MVLRSRFRSRQSDGSPGSEQARPPAWPGESGRGPASGPWFRIGPPPDLDRTIAASGGDTMRNLDLATLMAGDSLEHPRFFPASAGLFSTIRPVSRGPPPAPHSPPQPQPD